METSRLAFRNSMITLFNFGLMFILAAPAWTATYNFPTTGITDNICQTASIYVSGLDGDIRDVTLLLNVVHPYVGDLDIFLQAPSGEILELTTDNGGSGDNYTNTLFSAAGSSNITSGTAPFTGTFRPEGTTAPSGTPCSLTPTVTTFAGLSGLEPNGTWTLYLGDDVVGDSGALLNTTQLTLETAQIHRWSQRFGATNSDSGQSVATDAAGNVYVTGYFSGTVNFGGSDLPSAGDTDIFLASYTSAGTHRWSRRFGGTSSDYGWSVATDAVGNVYVTGAFEDTVNFGGNNLTSAGSTDLFLASYTSAGAHRWSHRFGGTSNDYGRSVATDAAGNVTVTGDFYGTANFGASDLTSAGGYDLFLASYTSAGTPRWSQRFGGTGGDYGRSVATDAAGNVTVTGNFSGANFGGSDLTSAGSADIFLASYTSAGAHRWSQRFGGTSGDYGWSVATDAAGNVYVTGYFSGTANFGGSDLTSAGYGDIFLASYDLPNDGMQYLLWTK